MVDPTSSTFLFMFLFAPLFALFNAYVVLQIIRDAILPQCAIVIYGGLAIGAAKMTPMYWVSRRNAFAWREYRRVAAMMETKNEEGGQDRKAVVTGRQQRERWVGLAGSLSCQWKASSLASFEFTTDLDAFLVSKAAPTRAQPRSCPRSTASELSLRRVATVSKKFPVRLSDPSVTRPPNDPLLTYPIDPLPRPAFAFPLPSSSPLPPSSRLFSSFLPLLGAYALYLARSPRSSALISLIRSDFRIPRQYPLTTLIYFDST
jgi:hypothetical protein